MTRFPESYTYYIYMTYPVDIHTHRLPNAPGQAIENCLPDAFQAQPEGWYSVGLHPWYVDKYVWNDDAFRSSFETILRHPQVLAVGEAGLDKLASVPLSFQLEVFRYQATLAETTSKPLIIHVVKAVDELLALHKELKPAVPWIIHGFRGKNAQAASYLRHGFYLSFGEKYNAETLRQVPVDRLFLETDESKESIMRLYERAADERGISAQTLRESVARNIRKVFFSH